MTPNNAENLLGGYATGTLNEREQRILFAAALEDQALFEALADEEALRALLADPQHRARLLALLSKPVVPLWRRPATLSLAASLLIAVGVGVVMRHVPVPTPVQDVVRPAQEEKPASPPAQPQAAVSHEPPPAPKQQARRFPPQPPPPSPAPMFRVPGSAGNAAGATPPPVAAKAESVLDEERAAVEASRRAKASEADASLSTSSQGMSMSRELLLPSQPTWTFEPAPAGQFNLTVLWGPTGHLYLLKRGSTATSWLAPVSSEPQSDGRMLSRFKGALGTGDQLDLYLLPQPADAPASLPSEGTVGGFRARVWPLEKKKP